MQALKLKAARDFEHTQGVSITLPDMMLGSAGLAVHIDEALDPGELKCWERVTGLLEVQQHLLKSRTEEKVTQGAKESEPRDSTIPHARRYEQGTVNSGLKKKKKIRLWAESSFCHLKAA